MIWIRWIIGSILIILSLGLIGLNSVVFWKRYIKREHTSSWIPLIGGVFGSLAFAILPLIPLHKWWWLPLILDWGSLPGIVVAILWNIWYVAKHRSK